AGRAQWASRVPTRNAPRASETADTFIGLLRASLGTGPIPSDLARCDWEHVMYLAGHHGLTPIVHRALSTDAANVPPMWQHECKARHVANAFSNQIALAATDASIAAFDRERIAVILMRGSALLRTLYDDPSLRVLSNVDLLVHDGDLDRAGRQVKRLGLDPIGSHPGRRGPICLFYRRYCRPEPRSVPVRLHSRLLGPVPAVCLRSGGGVGGRAPAGRTPDECLHDGARARACASLRLCRPPRRDLSLAAGAAGLASAPGATAGW